FLLFTLGLEFSLPRMLAMRREVFGLGSAQVVATASVFAVLGHRLGIRWLVAVVLGGAVAMSSTALLLQQLTERAELNRTHGRLAFSMLLFQDLAFVPFLALASALIAGQDRLPLSGSLAAALGAALAIVAVLAAGRWLLRPLFHEIAHSRLRELFTLAVLLVVLSSAWVSHIAGLSFAHRARDWDRRRVRGRALHHPAAGALGARGARRAAAGSDRALDGAEPADPQQQQARRPAPAARARPGAYRERARGSRHPRDCAPRARDPLRFRPRRPERGARARGAGLRVHRTR